VCTVNVVEKSVFTQLFQRQLFTLIQAAVGCFGSFHGPFWTYRKFMGRIGQGRFGIQPLSANNSLDDDGRTAAEFSTEEISL